MESKTAVIIGRFQTPYLHLGHIYLISHALQNYRYVLILLGESLQRDERNPYTLTQRRDMIFNIFNNSKINIRALNDCPGDDRLWSEQVDENVEWFEPAVLLHSRDSFK